MEHVSAQCAEMERDQVQPGAVLVRIMVVLRIGFIGNVPTGD
jgi:hypothetical protein